MMSAIGGNNIHWKTFVVTRKSVKSVTVFCSKFHGIYVRSTLQLPTEIDELSKMHYESKVMRDEKQGTVDKCTLE